MPKAELHLHLEGAIQPRTLAALARRHNCLDRLPATDADSLRNWFRFTDFRHFIDVYMTISDLLRTPADFSLAVTALGDELARHNVRYAEVTFTPYTHTHVQDKGLGIADLLAGLAEGRAQVQTQHGIDLRWVFDIPRNVSFPKHTAQAYDPKPADTTLEFALLGRPQGVIALGLGGLEVGAPPEPFAHAFAAARSAGLYALPHAGETMGATSVWGAVRALSAQRIGHGVRSIEDPQLLNHLRDAQIPLEVNITSNICLHVYRRAAHHPFPHLDRMGLVVTVNSDDPPLFNTDITAEYCLLADEFGYGIADIARIARNAYLVAACDAATRARLLDEFDTWVARHVPSAI
jgi:adenosine deaminase